MGKEYIKVDYDVFQGDINELNDNLNEVKNKLENMNNLMQEMNSVWQGDTKDVYMNRFKEDYEALKAFCGEIEKYIECINRAKSEYSQCESSIYDIIANING